ncbi:pentapeptide repeat-containing protein [Shewanella putrefaciens]|uniref:pentapeptide repeat-containing protein n=1 Tax=Shewanella putrefaciens TaxID=24 RepID=UPI003B3B8EF6
MAAFYRYARAADTTLTDSQFTGTQFTGTQFTDSQFTGASRPSYVDSVAGLAATAQGYAAITLVCACESCRAPRFPILA